MKHESSDKNARVNQESSKEYAKKVAAMGNAATVGKVGSTVRESLNREEVAMAKAANGVGELDPDKKV
ncbi:hypothetical protein P22_2366 [Propionispora sp. 2/2-37]|uniref:hypothetical protein n=1 Tax=Propionispora sp. 2/2-37 TaxID=1677858 RepID=UPI0006BB65B5|nr:hypothetical protein [Propionispora sp. 2/2-37]CUH96276.1 hypothetical protein P22_2366 [Propionispora sp. 2/2-37]